MFSKAAAVSRDKGALYVVRAAFNKLIVKLTRYAGYNYYRAFRASRTFALQGRNYDYFYHRYNDTWRNERAVEIPVIMDIVNGHKEGKTLEVGNVLSHYFKVGHDILDKYEDAEGVIREDIVNCRLPEKYGLIISISTLEHVGWDEKRWGGEEGDPEKVLRAVENLKNMLAPGGRIVFTVPTGYNPDMDRLIDEGSLRLGRLLCLKRVSRDNVWREVEWKDIRGSSYGSPFPAANGLVIGIIDKE